MNNIYKNLDCFILVVILSYTYFSHWCKITFLVKLNLISFIIAFVQFFILNMYIDFHKIFDICGFVKIVKKTEMMTIRNFYKRTSPIF